MAALASLGLPAVALGCAFDSQIAVQFSPGSPAVVKESFGPEHVPHRVHGVTMRDGQIVGIACSVTIVYDVEEATGSTVLVQRDLVHLRTRPLARGTRYALDCTGPLVVELPDDASAVEATATSASGAQVALPVQAPLSSVALAFGKRLRAEPRTQLALVRWPRALPRGDYRVELAFSLPEARAIQEKALDTASVACGRSRYLQPILPPIASMMRAPAFTIRPSVNPISFSVPRIAAGITSQAEATRTLSCVRSHADYLRRRLSGFPGPDRRHCSNVTRFRRDRLEASAREVDRRLAARVRVERAAADLDRRARNRVGRLHGPLLSRTSRMGVQRQFRLFAGRANGRDSTWAYATTNSFRSS